MKVFTKTDIGHRREENQDRVISGEFSDKSVFVVLCDGMGGENAGSYAAQHTAEFIKNYLYENYRENLSSSGIKNLLVAAINGANTEIFSKALEDPRKHGMGTTCVAALITLDCAYIINVGDSRAYHIYKDSMVQITRDHTYIRRLIDRGMITEDEAKRHPRRNCITKAIGAEEFVTGDFFEEHTFSDSMFLFSTDGLHSYVSDELTADIIGENPAGKICDVLIDRALELGGNDNITVALVVAV